MAVQSIGGVSAAILATSTGATVPTDATHRADPRSKDSTAKDSTIVISRITTTDPDGSTTTTITYADGHAKVETTPPRYAATEADGNAREGRLTAVDILA